MVTRREFVAATALGTAVTAAEAGSATAAPGEVDLSEWLADTDGADAVVDRTGRETVEVEVGASGNGGPFAFDPPVVRIDPGATVVWTWTGDGGSHDVVTEDGSVESPLQGDAGDEFQHSFADAGVTRYACSPHRAMGMRGAVVRGDVGVRLPRGAATPTSEIEATESTEADRPRPSFDGWLDGTDNYDGVHDRRGRDEVTVDVGASGNGGPFAFEPAAVRVDPGTVVRYRWVGPRRYDVVDPELGIESRTVAGDGHEHAVAFDGHGLSTYACSTYGDQGMRGVVVVGDGPREQLTWQGLGVAGGAAAVLGAPLALGVRLHERTATRSED